MKSKTIEELLTWAFVDELPKGGGVDGLENVNSAWRMLEASSWGKIAQVALLGQRIDEGGGGGNFFIEQGEPHADALAIGAAVAALGHCDVAFPAGWNPLADWSCEGEAAGLARAAIDRAIAMFALRTPARRGAYMVSLVVGTAILGRAPDWSADEPKVKLVDRGGKPAWFERKVLRDGLGGEHEVEVDGYNARAGRPVKGAYRKHEFSTDPLGDILTRLDWQIWVAACRRIAHVAGPSLTDHRLLPLDASITPWSAADAGGVAIIGRPSEEKTAQGR